MSANSEARKRRDDPRTDEELTRAIVTDAVENYEHGYHTPSATCRLLDEWRRRHPRGN